MNNKVYALCALLLCISLKSLGQNTPARKRISWGYLLKSNVNFFTTTDRITDFKTDIGWGLGTIVSAKLNNTIAVSLEPTLNFENHTLIRSTANAEVKLKGLNTVIPLKLNIELFKDLSLASGIEYLVLQSKQKEEIKLARNNFLASMGVNYAIKFRYFTVVPEISYRIGLNNAVEKSELSSLSARRSSVSFGVKVM